MTEHPDYCKESFWGETFRQTDPCNLKGPECLGPVVTGKIFIDTDQYYRVRMCLKHYEQTARAEGLL